MPGEDTPAPATMLANPDGRGRDRLDVGLLSLSVVPRYRLRLR
jgi:hypothetical protein